MRSRSTKTATNIRMKFGTLDYVPVWFIHGNFKFLCLGVALGRPHVGVKYNVEIFLSYLFLFHQLAYRSGSTPEVHAIVLKTRVLMNICAFQDFFVLKIRVWVS